MSVNITTEQAAAGLTILSNAAEETRTEILKYSNDVNDSVSIDDRQNYESLTFDTFYNSARSQAIKSMTNFPVAEFMKFWDCVGAFSNTNWIIGRGKRCKINDKDVIFMTMNTLKNGDICDLLSCKFNLKGFTFERIVFGFIKCIATHTYEKWVQEMDDCYSIQRFVEKKRTFRNKPHRRFATKVSFQQTNRCTGNIEEAKAYWS